MVQSGSFTKVFQKRGVICVENPKKTEEEVFEIAAEAGVDDFLLEDSILELYCDSQQVLQVKKKVEEQGLMVKSWEVISFPLSQTEVSTEDWDELMAFLNDLEALEDVSEVYHNGKLN
eukprot:TRINITY_DN6649_c0_g1_i1.p1 TRINITY_DN6649_c0_g1~~TRINITY_DN6649_c0_g1_i1.p1  ORF type:complete len:118 (+),score=27.85 TRINITY_DN6649_c0_g1_i1:165-518(+)